MLSRSLLLLLADDDSDDCLLFREALADIPVQAILETVPDGVCLMERLHKTGRLPDVLYLDLNMPKKGGLDCLLEIKYHPALSKIPVIVFTTSFQTETVDLLFAQGAQYYIQKPAEFDALRNIIYKSLLMVFKGPHLQSERNQFVLEATLDEAILSRQQGNISI